MVILKANPIMNVAAIGQGSICDEHYKFLLEGTI
jgi:hypothetical protein